MHTKQPLFDMEFYLFGETRMPREEVEYKIRAMGGKIASKVHTHLAAVISNAKEVKEHNEVIKEAFMHRIQVIPDDFLDEVMDNDPVLLIVKKDLSNWGKDVCSLSSFFLVLFLNFLYLRNFRPHLTFSNCGLFLLKMD